MAALIGHVLGKYRSAEDPKWRCRVCKFLSPVEVDICGTCKEPRTTSAAPPPAPSSSSASPSKRATPSRPAAAHSGGNNTATGTIRSLNTSSAPSSASTDNDDKDDGSFPLPSEGLRHTVANNEYKAKRAAAKGKTKGKGARATSTRGGVLKRGGGRSGTAIGGSSSGSASGNSSGGRGGGGTSTRGGGGGSRTMTIRPGSEAATAPPSAATTAPAGGGISGNARIATLSSLSQPSNVVPSTSSSTSGGGSGGMGTTSIAESGVGPASTQRIIQQLQAAASDQPMPHQRAGIAERAAAKKKGSAPKH